MLRNKIGIKKELGSFFMSGKYLISPIAIDLGAKNTGVYFAHYKAGSSLLDIKREGKVYQLDQNSYTLLMADRTAKRHQRRGIDRRQKVKRLFKLVWEQQFGLEWDKNVQQTISFLLNRRGFSFITEDYDADILRQFPREVIELMPNKLKDEFTNNHEHYDYASLLTNWTNEGEEKIRSMFEVLDEEPKRIRGNLIYIDRTDALRDYCKYQLADIVTDNKTKKLEKKLERIPFWIWDKWINAGVSGLDKNFANEEWKNSNSFNLVIYLSHHPALVKPILKSLPETDEEKKTLKDSYWNFKADKFQLEKNKFIYPENLNGNATKKNKNNFEKQLSDWRKSHLQHLAFALKKTLDELQSGSRHRSEYFNEVKNVLERDGHTHQYLKKFCDNLHKGNYSCANGTVLNVENMTNLIGHLSNLELKPLRKYFDDKGSKKRDYWSEASMSRIFERWILSEWRVDKAKNKDKSEGAKGDYNKLRSDWKNHIQENGSDSVICFWLKTNPFFTIPPYQDNNNRRPPRCQTLILNPVFLNDNYPDWKLWINELKNIPDVQEYLINYESELLSLKSGKYNSYFNNEFTNKLKKDSGRRSINDDLNARILQFIFDRVKKDDPLKLNELYSNAKKYRQRQSTLEDKEKALKKLNENIRISILPAKMKRINIEESVDLLEEGSFLHLACNYYKWRQRARDARIFIHPEYRYSKKRGYENTWRFDDKKCLLTYCNHKPRQKRYQLTYDLACALHISPRSLEAKCGDTEEKLLGWLESIGTLKRRCEQAVSEQKDRRGRLKTDIQSVYSIIDYQKISESPAPEEIERILKNSKVQNASKLYKLCEIAKTECLAITIDLYDELQLTKLHEKLRKNPASAIYMLSQIYNIAFKDRNGNANICPVCNADNANRMQRVISNSIKESHAKSQRLPAISTRLIDGAVMRMARIVAGEIANDKWKIIESELRENNIVRVPIIIESNSFEFEPNLQEIKGKRPDRSYIQANILDDKSGRIREASGGVCPYTGEDLGSGGDEDHIIPRSSQWGVLNDEANLIWASERGNREIKGNTYFSLVDLNSRYKKNQFDGRSDSEIKEWIIDQIDGGETGDFKFGQYYSFVNLTYDQRKAFRHSLFLENDHPLRKKVIKAIYNRNRTFVNGTQRYFAQVLADILHKKAKRVNKSGMLEFDYFEIEAHRDPRGYGVSDLRKEYEEHYSEISEYKKDREEKQDVYSHLIDAQIAFAIVTNDHKNYGGLRLEVDDSYKLFPVDKGTGEIYETIFNVIKVRRGEMDVRGILRARPRNKFFTHRQIHRDGIYAERYLPILILKNKNEIRIGFDLDNSFPLKDTEVNRKKLYFALKFNQPGFKLDLSEDVPFSKLKEIFKEAGVNSKKDYFYLSLCVNSIHSYYIENYNTEKGYRTYTEEMKFLREALAYRTEKKQLENLDDARGILNDLKNFQVNSKLGSKKYKISLPVKKEWEKLVREWEKSESDDEFLRKYFEGKHKGRQPHEKVRKVFSLPIKTDEGKILVKRKSWNEEDIFQIVNDSDSREVSLKPFTPVYCKIERCLTKRLSNLAFSKNIFLLKNEKYLHQLNEDTIEIDPNIWFSIELDQEIIGWGVDKIEYRIDNITRPQVRVTLNREPKLEDIEEILECPLLRARSKDGLRKRLKSEAAQNNSIEYSGNGFQNVVLQRLIPSLDAYYG